ncbi:MAG TPA: pyrroline-5-carboxylate reductase [Candidatus Limnocylindrales bacterium]|nr:pyrroline-5-carboxylate reductase [Candidatus Limnocylindrales bacterium]
MVKNGIGLLGCGAMGSALAKGMIKRGGVDPALLWIYDINKERQLALANELDASNAETLADLIPHCRHVFIAVKPQDIEGLLYSIKKFVGPDQLLTSIAAGITIGFIESCLPSGTKVIRLMPNTPCLIGEGAIAISIGDFVAHEEREQVEELLKPLGMTIRIPEKLMDAVTGLSGTGPAYVYLFIETLIDAGVSVGIRRDVASKLVIQTLIGSARMLEENSQHPAELRNIVTSPAGTTSAAMLVLEEFGFRSCLIKAVIEAAKRSEELRRG